MKTFITSLVRLATILVFIVCFGFVHVFGQTIVTSNLAGNTTWDVDGSPYIITKETFIIDTDDTLWVEPNVEVRLNKESGINVKGHLSVESAKITANNNIWNGIYSSPEGSISINNSIIEKGGGGATYAHVLNVDDNCVITNNDIINNNVGIYMSGAAMITGNYFANNDKTPLSISLGNARLQSNNLPTLSNNEFGGGNSFNAIGLNLGIYENDPNPAADSLYDLKIPYVPFKSYSITNNDSLTIMPGVVIKFSNNNAFDVSPEAHFKAVGTDTNPIIFTSTKDDNAGEPGDTNFDGNDSSPGYNDWDGLYFEANQDVELSYIRVRYGSDPSNENSGIVLNNANVNISNSEISNTNRGITVLGDAAQPTIQNNTIFSTKNSPIALSLTANPTLINNDISNAGLRAIGLVSETIEADGTIRRRTLGGFENITYAMMGDIKIANGTTLDIEPGVVIKAGKDVNLIVEGALSAVGDENYGSVFFTSTNDDNIGNPLDTNNDVNGSAPAPDDWGTIIFKPIGEDANSILDNVEIRFAKHGIIMNNANTAIENTVISNPSFFGIALDKGSSPLINNVTIKESGLDPIAMSIDANPDFNNITFENNDTNGIGILEGQSALLTSNSRNNKINPDRKYFSGNNTITVDSKLGKRNVAGIENIPYIIRGSTLAVGTNTTLDIEKGVVIKFDGGGLIVVNGALKAEGTEAEPIYLTSIADDSKGGDTNNDGNSEEPERGDWTGLFFNDSAIEDENTLKNARIRFAGRPPSRLNTEAILHFSDSFALVDSIVIEQISGNGIGIFGDASPEIKNSQILNLGYVSADGNQGVPVIMDMFSNPTFDNILTSNVASRLIGIRGETWTNDATIPKRDFAGFDNISYQLLGDIRVGTGTTITIPAGIVIKSEGSFRSNNRNSHQFIIDGAINVAGSETEPVVFTHLADDTYGNPSDAQNNGDQLDQASKLYYSWIQFNENSDDGNSVINYGIFKHRDERRNNTAGIYLNNASPTISNSLFESNYNGIYLNRVSEPVLENNTFFNSGIALRGSILSFPKSASGNELTGSTLKAIGIESETLTRDYTLKRRDFAGIEGIPYFFTGGHYTVGTGAILTIEPGVISKFSSGVELKVQNGLIADGTPDSKIVFTAIEDDFYGGNTDSRASHPTSSATQWRGISFETESISEFSKIDHVIIRHVSNGWFDDEDDEYAGINLYSSSPTITNSVFQLNRNGIKVAGASNPVINNNDIYDNLEYGVLNVDQTFTIDATNNWWGNDSGPRADGNPGGTGDRVSEGVSFMPFEGGGATNPQLGDVALNGRIMAYDASVVLKSQVGLETLSEAQQRAADVSGDGTVSAMDASFILQFVVNLIQNFPADMRTKGKTPEPLAEVSDISLSIGSPEVREEGVSAIPVYMENIENLLSFSIQMDGLHEGYQFIGVEKGELLTDASLHANAEGSVIKSAMASTELIHGSGNVLTLLFEATDPEQDIGLELDPVQFIANETDMSGLVTSTDETDIQKPEEFALQQNYPNPFNPSTTIRFDLPARTDVTLEVYNMIGQRVARLAGGDSFSAGSHTLTFDASGLASGMYIYRIQATNTEAGDSGFLQTRKMMLIK